MMPSQDAVMSQGSDVYTVQHPSINTVNGSAVLIESMAVLIKVKNKGD